MTPDHPTADGHKFGDLVRGDRLDGVRVDAIRRVDYDHPFTYDILPESDTGTYVAGGVVIGSALATPVTGRITDNDAARSGRRASLAPPPDRNQSTTRSRTRFCAPAAPRDHQPYDEREKRPNE